MSGRHRQGVGGAAGVARWGWRQSRELQWRWFYVDGDGSCDNGDGFTMIVMVEVMMKIKWLIFFGLSLHSIIRVINCKFLYGNLLWDGKYHMCCFSEKKFYLDTWHCGKWGRRRWVRNWRIVTAVTSTNLIKILIMILYRVSQKKVPFRISLDCLLISLSLCRLLITANSKIRSRQQEMSN